MEIQNVTIEDAEELLDIYAPYVKYTAITFEYDVPSVEEFRQRIVNISNRYPYIKAVDNGQIVGYAYAGCFKDRRAYDWSVETTIYVRQDCKRMGIGRLACIACPEQESKYLNDDSIRFHSRLGFSEVGRFHDSGYKFNQWFDMVWMEKMIGEHNAEPKEVWG